MPARLVSFKSLNFNFNIIFLLQPEHCKNDVPLKLELNLGLDHSCTAVEDGELQSCILCATAIPTMASWQLCSMSKKQAFILTQLKLALLLWDKVYHFSCIHLRVVLAKLAVFT